jgi:drug/metabolite transporter (DMT)-like permease
MHHAAFKSFAWMTGSLISFCVLAIATRELDKQIPVQEIIVFRSGFGLIVITALIFYLKQTELFRTERPKLQITRNTFHFFGQYGWLFGIGYLSLADVFALEFTVPVWVAIIAALFLQERLTKPRILSIGLGLAGVVIIVNPTAGILDSASLVVLGAAVCYAVAHTTNKSLTGTENPLTLLFYMSLVQLPIGVALSVTTWKAPSGVEWMWLASIGAMALTGHYCLNRAMHLAEVGFVMTIDFLRLPMIAVVGLALYMEPLKLTLLVGGLVILAGNIINLRDQLQRYK